MDIRPECVPCLMTRVLFQAKLADNGTEFSALSAAMNTYAKKFKEGKNSAAVATEVHRSAYSAMCVKDPYLALKKRSDEVASKHVGIAEDAINTSKDRFRTAVLMSAIGNIMDFGSGIAIDHPDMFRDEFDRMVAQGIGSDDTEKMLKELKGSKRIVYLFDNCGETYFDILLIKEIRRMGVNVTGVVRGEAILNDVTMEDAERIGLRKEVDELLSTSQFAIGMDIEKIGNDLKNALKNADMIIAKGMANYESLSDQQMNIPVVHILRSKCRPVADSLNVPVDINVVRFVGGN